MYESDSIPETSICSSVPFSNPFHLEYILTSSVLIND